MLLSKLIEDMDILNISGSLEVRITGIAYNSNEVKPGHVFVCVPGFKADGHDFAFEAVEKGAVAIIAEKQLPGIGVTALYVKNARIALSQIAAAYYDHPEKKLKLIGVTGTNGKTTITHLIKSILEHNGKSVGLIGTNHTLIGKTIIPSVHTTPDSLELMKLFSLMVGNNTEYAVMEVSSHSLALERTNACYFDIAAFSNLTQDHLDFHGSMEKYLEAKIKLFSKCGIGIINIDDKASENILKTVKCPVMTYGIDGDCCVKAENIIFSEGRVEFDIYENNKTVSMELCIPGRFSVYNALTAISCCLAAGLDFTQISEGLKVAGGVKGRIEVVKCSKDFTVIIDYAHTPDGLYNVLKTIRGFAKGRIVTLFGCGGDRDKTKRDVMGSVAGENSDFCIITSDNPRTENPGAIIEDILAGIKQTKCEYVVVENRFEAIEYALDHAEKDDIILLAGKGHETYQVLNDRIIDFDEREIVVKLLNLGE